MIMCLGYFFYYEFVKEWPLKFEQKNEILTFFKILRIYIFVVLVIFTTFKIPYLDC